MSPKIQIELMDTLFRDFQRQFKHFFDLCERGFVNEFIINMYCRSYDADHIIIPYG